MRYLFVIRSLTGGGAERVLTIIANNLSNQQNEVFILCYSQTENDYTVSKNVHIIEMPKRRDSFITKILRISDMRKMIKKIKPDVIIPFVGTVVYVSWIAKIGLKAKYILTVRNNPWRIPERKIYHYYRDHISKKADAIMVQNEEQKEYFSPVQQKKVFIVPNPVDDNIIKGIKKDYCEKPRKIVSVGRMNYQKNFTFLLNNFSKIIIDYPELELDIYGIGEEEKKLSELIEKKGIVKNCHLMGRTNDVSKVLKKYDLFIMTSLFEGMPNALMEAMAVGLPCLSSNCLTGPKTLLNNKKGFLYENENSDDFISKLEFIIKNYSIAKEYSKRAREYIINNYNSNIILEKFNIMMEQVKGGIK